MANYHISFVVHEANTLHRLWEEHLLQHFLLQIKYSNILVEPSSHIYLQFFMIVRASHPYHMVVKLVSL